MPCYIMTYTYSNNVLGRDNVRPYKVPVVVFDVATRRKGQY